FDSRPPPPQLALPGQPVAQWALGCPGNAVRVCERGAVSRAITFGRQVTGDLDAASAREWLVTDGLGGYAMGTVGGLRTRRYHGLLVVATQPPGGRMLGLAALDSVLTVGDARLRLAVHEWADGSIDPGGNVHLAGFELVDGLP